MTSLVLLSPLDLSFLGLTIQSLLVTCPYSDFLLYVAEKSGDKETEAFLKGIEDERVKGVLPWNDNILETGGHLVFLPPGVVFLREQWLDRMMSLLSESPSIVFTQDRPIFWNGSEVRFPSLASPVAYSSELIEDIDLPPEFNMASLDIYLFLMACERRLQSYAMEKNWFHIYKSCPFPFQELTDEGALIESIEKLKSTLGGNVDGIARG